MRALALNPKNRVDPRRFHAMLMVLSHGRRIILRLYSADTNQKLETKD